MPDPSHAEEQLYGLVTEAEMLLVAGLAVDPDQVPAPALQAARQAHFWLEHAADQLELCLGPVDPVLDEEQVQAWLT